jgi:hypothetical protein
MILIIKTYFFNRSIVNSKVWLYQNQAGKFIIHSIKATIQNYVIQLMHIVVTAINTIHIKIFKEDIAYLQTGIYVI